VLTVAATWLETVEAELYVDRVHLIRAGLPPGTVLPAVTVRMPPYTAGGLAHLVDDWNTIFSIMSGCASPWLALAQALLRAGRDALPRARDVPELVDLALPLPDGGDDEPGLEFEVVVDRRQLIQAEYPAGTLLPAVVVRMPPYVAAMLAHIVDQWAAIGGMLGAPGAEWVPAAQALLTAARVAAPAGAASGELGDLVHHPLAGERRGGMVTGGGGDA
jgi:hypothetical protein